jgi:hypothetical protein
MRLSGFNRRQIRRQVSLEALLREGPGMAEQAEAALPVHDDGPPPRRIARGAGERGRNGIAHHGEGARRRPRAGGGGRQRRRQEGERRQPRPPRPHARRRSVCRSGSDRTRLPVAAKIALSTAGAATAMVGSPTPPQKPPEGMTMVSTFGISAMRIIG